MVNFKSGGNPPLSKSKTSYLKAVIVLSFIVTFLIAVTASARAVTIEGFESGNLSLYTEAGVPTVSAKAAAAHDGLYGLEVGDTIGSPEGWIYRDDPPVQLAQGDLFSVWIRTSSLEGKAYFGFGANASVTYTLALNLTWGILEIKKTSSNYQLPYDSIGESDYDGYTIDTWYRAEVEWGVGGHIVGRLYGSDGITLLSAVSGDDNTITSGGIAFRAFDDGGVKHFDSVELIPEPVPFLLLGSGLLGLAWLGKKESDRG